MVARMSLTNIFGERESIFFVLGMIKMQLLDDKNTKYFSICANFLDNFWINFFYGKSLNL